MVEPGWIVVLNGAPRAGKSSIVRAVQDGSPDPWINLGVDVIVRGATPPSHRPGIGLRPGGERPDLEPFVVAGYHGLYASVVEHSRLGLRVVVDVGHHDSYSRPLGILTSVARRLAGLPTLFVGVHCPVDEIMRRRDVDQPGREGEYARTDTPGVVPEPVARWQREVHRPGIYDLEVDTSVLSPAECAERILARVAAGEAGTAFARLAAGADSEPGGVAS